MRALRVAVIDIGTNSTRLLVADVEGGRLTELERRSRVTGLGRGVDTSGNLSEEGIDSVCAAIGGYLEIAGALGAARTVALATSAVRDAGNGGAFLAELRERFALGSELIDGEREARLTFRGATASRPSEGRTLVIDIGGGSTELVIGSPGAVDFHASLQLGVVRHSERHLRSDPPGPKELEELGGAVREQLAAARAEAGEAPAAGIAVAGTPTALAAMELGLDPYDREAIEGYELGLEAAARQCSRLASMPLAERRGVQGLHPDRAPMIVAGVVILIAAMRSFGLERITVSERDLLWGAALEAGEQPEP